MGQFEIEKTNLDGVVIITPRVFSDDRGFFMECYSERDFAAIGINEKFVQDNHSMSKMGVVRGLHYQLKAAPMGKLVKCVAGEIYDVGVDVRKGSSTFGKWFGTRLSGLNMKMLYFPPGIAHGFLSMHDDTHVIYKCVGFHSKENERGISWNDPALKISWPTAEVTLVTLSAKDMMNPNLNCVDLFE